MKNNKYNPIENLILGFNVAEKNFNEYFDKIANSPFYWCLTFLIFLIFLGLCCSLGEPLPLNSNDSYQSLNVVPYYTPYY